MMGKSQNLEPKLFYHTISLEARMPQEHPLRKIKQLVDFNFIRSRVSELYGKNGNSSVDPAVILKLMFLLFYENIKSERVLMEKLPLRLDWLWFCGYDLDDQTPNHSVISKARRRWGQEGFQEFFANILQQCTQAGLVDGKTIHIDSSMIDGNVSKDTLKPQLRLVGQKLYDEIEAQSQLADTEHEDDADCQGPQRQTLKQVSDTDPDARLGRKNGQTVLGYKDHRVIDDKCGIITATITTPANTHDAKVFTEAIETHQANTGIKVDTAVADKIYGNSENYKYLKDHNITSCVPHQRYGCKQNVEFSHDRFTYDTDNDCYICPAGKPLYRYDHDKPYQNNSYRYRAKRDVCRQCDFFDKCVSSKTNGRQIIRNVDAEYVTWADECLNRYQRQRLMSRRKCKAEGSFADATNNHGFKRSRWRGIVNVCVQNLMIAAIQNIRKLLRHLSRGSRPACVALASANSQYGMLLLKSVVLAFIFVRERIQLFQRALSKNFGFVRLRQIYPNYYGFGQHALMSSVFCPVFQNAL
jgi:transposase